MSSKNGPIFQTTDEEAPRQELEEGQVSYYTGYDPTADSLHLGHLVAIFNKPSPTVGWTQTWPCWEEHRVLLATHLFKDAERSLQTKETVEGWRLKAS